MKISCYIEAWAWIVNMKLILYLIPYREEQLDDIDHEKTVNKNIQKIYREKVNQVERIKFENIMLKNNFRISSENKKLVKKEIMIFTVLSSKLETKKKNLKTKIFKFDSKKFFILKSIFRNQ